MLDDLKLIQHVLMGFYNIETELVSSLINPTNARLFGSSDYIRVLVVAPHEGNDHKWLLRMSPAVSFDRWANSTSVEERFKSSEDLKSYLIVCKYKLYQQLFETLSGEYEELRNEKE